MKDYVFGLDIGTRTVIGLVCAPQKGALQVIAQEITEHESRSMIDGQIHDIPRVAEAVARVKEGLEQKTGFGLNQVAVAAAGRALVTRQVRVTKELGSSREIEAHDINSLELEGLRQAHLELEKMMGSGSTEKFYCVGYSVVNYFADNFAILNLQGQWAEVIGAEILATFLPEAVVNSLYSVLKRVDLEPVSLTLEPIAAIDVAIPEDLRLLNLALVDVGAGTSDIAISRKGSVVAYGMVPLAGDEVTEALLENCLVDFNTAEKIKRSMAGEPGTDITFRDVLGAEKTITYEEAMSFICPVLDSITEEIAQTIKNLNGQVSPRAVFCVGGGSQTPQFTDMLAEKLGLSPSLVAVKGRKQIPGIKITESDDEISGPEGVTVVGISTVAMKKFGHDFLTIKINDQDYRLFNSKELEVGNAIALIGYDPRQLIGRNGANLEFWLNDIKELVPGGLAIPSKIFINNKPANLKTQVKDGDYIVIQAAVDGEDGRAVVGSYLDRYPTRIVMLGETCIQMVPIVTVNQQPAAPDTAIKPGDRVEIKYPDLKTILAGQGIEFEQFQVRVNGEIAMGDWVLRSGDQIELSTPAPKPAPAPEPDKKAPAEAAPPEPENLIHVELNGKTISLDGSKHYLFVDILRYLDFDLTRPQGSIILLHNDSEAKFTEPLKDGDRVKIFWQ
ncbi:MAG: molecular chaperone Hsp70 [Firmicutes bacterium]|nr:molecular chaperone Hsp70 [Bacillota bacterium]